MIEEDAVLSIVILTEDSGQDGCATVEALVRRMLHLVVPGFGSHRVHFVPRDPREEEAMRGNVWKTDGKNPQEHERRVRLLKYIVRKLSLADTFVLFHIDGDRPWGERHTSENTAKFERLVRSKLLQVADRGRANGPKTKVRAQPSADPPLLHLEHLLLICPFRSIEAWLYQNLRAAIDICGRQHRGAHVTEIQEWEGQREGLDELPAPETVVCLGKVFNLELAERAFPAREVYEVKKSFAESVDRLRACGAPLPARSSSRAAEVTPDDNLHQYLGAKVLTGSSGRLALGGLSSPAGAAAEGLAGRVPQRTHVRARETTNPIEPDGSGSRSARTV